MNDDADVVVVHLGQNVRRVGAAHACDDGCDIHPRRMHVTHSATIVDGGRYELWTREDGYPPHMG